MLEEEARARLGPDATAVTVRSSGIHGWDRYPAVEGMQRAAADLGVDLSGHRSSRTTPADVERAHLVLTMTESQRRVIHESVPAATPCTFTLREFARLAGQVGPVTDGSPAERLTHLVAACHAARESPVGQGEDVADPYGGSYESYRRTADEVAALVAQVAGALFGP